MSRKRRGEGREKRKEPGSGQFTDETSSVLNRLNFPAGSKTPKTLGIAMVLLDRPLPRIPALLHLGFLSFPSRLADGISY